MNLQELTPAPWEAKTFLVVATSLPRGMYGGLEICHTGITGNHNTAECEANAHFISLARNAFDVMMRRGWSVCKSDTGWFVDLWKHHSLLSASGIAKTVDASDPFTALVEADRWYKEYCNEPIP